MPPSSQLTFSFRGTVQSLPFGGTFGVPIAAGFSDAPPSEVEAIAAAIRAGRPWQEEIRDRFRSTRPWLHDIILSPRRRAFLKPLLPDPGQRVLDIGCGWGQLTLPLARAGHEVVALEPVAARLDFVQATAGQQGCSANIAFVGADYFECDFGPAFSSILAIGVLEWAGAFQTGEDPQIRQQRFLRKAKQELKAGGRLIIGIENRMGLKYLLGCPDDHLGAAGIACLPAELARRRWREKTGLSLQSFTYSDVELRQLLLAAGFTTVEFFGAFPDYKLCEEIIALGDGGKRLNQLLRTGRMPAEHNGYNGDPLEPVAQENLTQLYRSLAEQEIAHHFVPSFFVRAT